MTLALSLCANSLESSCVQLAGPVMLADGAKFCAEEDANVVTNSAYEEAFHLQESMWKVKPAQLSKQLSTGSSVFC